MREFDRVLVDLEGSPRKALLKAPLRDVLSLLPRAQRQRVAELVDGEAPIGALRGRGPWDALILRDQTAMARALERFVRESSSAAGQVRPGMDRDALVAWATDAGVRDLLELPVRALVDPRGAWTYGDRSVISAVCEPPSVGPRETVLQRVQLAVCDRLEAAAADVAQGRAEEATLPTEPPSDPRLRALWTGLTALRTGLRSEVSPTAAPDAVPRLDPARGGLVVTTWRTCPRSGGLAGSVALGLRGAPALACGCGRRDGRCGLGLALVDRALRGLHGDLGPKVADWLGEPAWVDRLRRMDAALAERAGAGPVAWRVELGASADVKPVAVGAHGLVPLNRATLEPQADVDREVLLLTGRGEPEATFLALRRLAGHPRVYLDAAPVEVALGTLGLRLVPTMFGARLLVLVDGAPASSGALDGAVRVGNHGLALRRGGRLVLYGASPALRALVADLREGGDSFRAEALPALMARWPRLAAVTHAEVDPALIGGGVEAAAEPVVVLAARGVGLQVDVRVRVGDASFAPGVGDEHAWRVDDGRLVQVRRALADERSRVARLCDELGLAGVSSAVEDPDAAWRLLDRLPTAGVAVVWTGPRRRALRPPVAADLRLVVGAVDRFFAVGGAVELGGASVPLAELVIALRERRGTVLLGDDLVQLAGPLVERLRALDALSTPGERGEWLLPAVAAPLVRELADGATVEADGAFRLAVERFRAAATAEPVVPEGFGATLRPYQVDGFRFLARLGAWAPGALLCDDMGLGKTVQTLALLAARGRLGPQLVVAPTSVMTNWAREAARFAPWLQVVVHHGAGRDLGAPGPGALLVTSWDLLVRDEALLARVPFATAVLDEAQATKTASTRRARAARALPVAFRVLLTGTPVENRLSELWSLVDLAVPGLLGDARTFRERFAGPIERERDPAAREALGRLLAPFLLRRTKAEVARELPARSEVIVSVDLDPIGRSTYDRWRHAALDDLARRDLPAQNQRVLVLAALTALRQVASAPHLVDKTLPRTSAKLERLREIVAELREQGHQALVFSQFVSLLAVVREQLAADGARLAYLDGSTPAAVRQEEVDRFQRGEADVFLVSLKAGGTGLNLTAASYVIHLDPWWNPAAEDQATDRAHRIGQDKPVTVYKLVSRGTVEEAIVAMQGEKRALVEGVLGDAGKAAQLPLDELVALLSFGVG